MVKADMACEKQRLVEEIKTSTQQHLYVQQSIAHHEAYLLMPNLTKDQIDGLNIAIKGKKRQLGELEEDIRWMRRDLHKLEKHE